MKIVSPNDWNEFQVTRVVGSLCWLVGWRFRVIKMKSPCVSGSTSPVNAYGHMPQMGAGQNSHRTSFRATGARRGSTRCPVCDPGKAKKTSTLSEEEIQIAHIGLMLKVES